jgi:hypothetical protein
MTTQMLSAKDPAEQIAVTFDFSAGIIGGETITGTPSVTASATGGSDTSPSAILSGAPLVSGSLVMQTVVGGLDGSTYKLRCLITLTPSNRKLVLAGLLPVVTA